MDEKVDVILSRTNAIQRRSVLNLKDRFPLSAGEVRYINAAFSKKWFATLAGWLIIFTGIVSSAALTNATAGFIQDFVDLPHFAVTCGIVIFLGLVAAWGITQSVALVTAITLIEIGGLLLIIHTGADNLAALPERWHELLPTENFPDFLIWGSILSGAFLAFYAFIGFEDMVNIAEEVKDVHRNMPYAIIICIVLTLVFYVLVSLVAVLSVAPQELAQSNTPLATIMEKTSSAVPSYVIALISMLATVNGALVQLIMGARVLYGMAKGGEAPKIFASINSKTCTPLPATGFVIVIVLIAALLFDLPTLAKITSAIILFIFACVNAALLKIKSTESTAPVGMFTTPWWLPLIGLVVCIIMLGSELWANLAHL